MNAVKKRTHKSIECYCNKVKIDKKLNGVFLYVVR